MNDLLNTVDTFTGSGHLLVPPPSTSAEMDESVYSPVYVMRHINKQRNIVSQMTTSTVRMSRQVSQADAGVYCFLNFFHNFYS
jgi:hypothetical protein